MSDLNKLSIAAARDGLRKGDFTSRDLTENVEQMQVLESLKLVRARVVPVLARLADLFTTLIRRA